MKNSNKGFTLIELMIVVAIIAIIAAIAIPNLLRSRMQSNESSAIGNLRTIVGSEVAYHAANYEYTADFADLTGATPSFLDGNWAGTKSGYNYVLGGDANNFIANANAAVYGTTDLFLERLGLKSLQDLPPLADHIPPADFVDTLEESLRPGSA